MSPLLEDDVLAGMFAELAESVSVPPEGAADALAAIRAGRVEKPAVVDLSEVRDRRRKRLGTVVGIAAAVAIIGGVSVAATRGGSGQSGSVATSDARISSGRLPLAATSGAGSGAASDAGTSGDPTGSGAAAASGTTATSTTATGTTKSGTAASGTTKSGTAASGSALSGLTPAGPAPAGAAAGSVPSVDADRVIRTGDVTLVVPSNGDVAPTVTKLAAAATTGLGGFLQDSATQQADPKSGGIPTASVTLRVPAEKFDALVTRVEALGTVVTSMTNGKDVTAQFVDLDARLTALKTSRETYLVILSKANTVNDTLAVQQRLDDLQQQIEQLQGQQNALKAQSDLSTLTVEVSGPTPKPKAVVPPKKPKAKSGLAAAFDKAGDRFRRGTESVIAALGTIALLLVALLVLAVAYRVGRRIYIRRTV